MEKRDIYITLVLFSILVVLSIASSDFTIETKGSHVKETSEITSSNK